MMNKRFYKILIFGSTLFALLASCDSTQEIQVGILWQDDPHFEDSSFRYLGILKGKSDFDTGFEGNLLQCQSANLAENNTYYFSYPSSGVENYTAFIFVDINADSSFDEGYDVVTGYKYNYGEPGDPLIISLSSFY